MPSIRSRLYVIAMRAGGLRGKWDRIQGLIEHGKPPAVIAPTPPPGWMLRKYVVSKESVDGRIVYSVGPRDETIPDRIFFLHGGGYVGGITKFHWKFVTRLIDRLSCGVVLPDYPLAPQCQVDDALAMVLSAYRNAAGAAGDANLTLMGDSAGGGMALALAQIVRDLELKPPRRIILLSPWLDVTMSCPGVDDIDRVDPVLGVRGLVDCGRMYAGDVDRRHYTVSPLYGDLHGLPPVFVFTGTRDVLMPDCRRLRDKAAEAGLELSYYEYPGLYHDWMLTPVPEAAQVLDKIAEIVRSPAD